MSCLQKQTKTHFSDFWMHNYCWRSNCNRSSIKETCTIRPSSAPHHETRTGVLVHAGLLDHSQSEVASLL